MGATVPPLGGGSQCCDSSMKQLIKRVLAKLGWSWNRVPSGVVVGYDLGRDLGIALLAIVRRPYASTSALTTATFPTSYWTS